MADVDRCVCCGEIVPEGRMVCPNCEEGSKANQTIPLRRRIVYAGDVFNSLMEERGWSITEASEFMRAFRDADVINAPTVDAVEVDEVREFARDVAYQFGYYCQNRGRLHITHGGLSTLEWAFDILGWENPHPVPECECEVDGCHEHATCGSPTADGYKRMCGRHMREKTAQTAEIDFDYEAED